MSQTLAEKVGDHIAESVREATRATTEVTDAFADGLHAAQRSAKQGYVAAGKCVANQHSAFSRTLCLQSPPAWSRAWQSDCLQGSRYAESSTQYKRNC